jgi:FkbM family methyltransferase
LFSWYFLVLSARLSVRYLGTLGYVLHGRRLGEELHRRRVEEWRRVSPLYRDRPRRTLLGFDIYLNPEDFSPVSTSIGVDGVLDIPLTSLFLEKLGRGMRVVDVGANLGYFTLLASGVVGPSGRVYAFEPDPYNASLLEKSVAHNRADNVEVVRRAVCDRAGIVQLYRAPPGQPQAHSTMTDWGHGSLGVEATTLDGFWADADRPKIHMVKAHVVGDEPVVLRGSLRLLEEGRPMLAIVFDPPKWRGEARLLSRLFEWYRVYTLVHAPWLLREVTQDSLDWSYPQELYLEPRRN